MKKILASILAICLVLSTMSFVVLAADTDVYTVGEDMTYGTLKDALTAAKDNDSNGAVTIEIYGKVEIGATFQINVAVDTVNIVGKTTDAEICVVTPNGGDNGNIYVANNNIEAVNFSNLILCRHNGGWRDNEGHSTHFFTVWDSDGSTDLITYTNCVFPEGASNNQYGKTTYTDCTFNKDDYYALWIYGSGSSTTVEVTGCTFVADRGVKVYSEDASAFVNTTVENSTFDIASKPAIVSSIAGNLVIEEVNATACEYGLLASEPKDGRNDLSSASVTVDGKTPVYVAKVGNMVCTDMDYANAETNDAKPIEPVVAMIGTKPYTTITEALNAITDNSTIVISEGEYDVALSINKSNVTVKGNGEVVFTQTPSIKGTNYYVEGIDFNYNNGTGNLAGTGKIVDCNFTANENTFRYCYGSAGTIEFDRCNLTALNMAGNTGWAIHFDSASGLNLVLNDCNVSGKVALGANLGSFTASGTDFNNYYINVWGTETGATFTDCEFKDVPYVFTGYDEDNTVKFNNCTTNDEEGIAGLIWGGVKDADAEIAIDGVVLSRVCRIGDVYYVTLEDAVAAANDGAVIDLFGNVVVLPEVNSIKITKDLTIKNGTIDITNGTWNGNSIIEVYGGTANDFVVATFENVDFIGDNYSSAYGIIYAYNNGKAVVNGCNFNLSNEKYSAGGVLKGNGVAQSAFDVKDSTFDLENPNRIIANATVNLDNVKIDAVVTDDTLVVGDMNNHAFRNLVGTVNNSNISVDGFETGIKNTEGNLVISGNSLVVLTNSKDTDLVVGSGKKVEVTEGSHLYADTSDIADDAIVEGEGFISKADKVFVQYKKVDVDANGVDTLEGADKYEIVLLGANEEKINELASADLTFNFKGTPVKGGAMDYSVVPAKGVTLTQVGDRFMFNYNGVDKYEESGTAIVIGTLTVDGYGSYTLATSNVETNAVYATEIRDNVVDGFEDAAYLVINADPDTTDGMVGEIKDGEGIIKVPTRTLTVNVAFPNTVKDNDATYQNMKVEITGNIDGVTQTIPYALGDAANAGNIAAYVVEEDRLVLNESYTVTVSGAGYRTARYTVTMTDNKTLNFWNNVKDNKVEIEEGKASSAVELNFLAGDIVADNNINIYDLSAVVSYFTQQATVTNGYVKYDLNRDGKIDSKDVAYILVSWGK